MAKMVGSRDRKKEAGWRRHIVAQAGSGLSIAGYCRRHRLRQTGFYWWRRELARRDADPPVAFVPVTVAHQPPVHSDDGQIEIILPRHRRVRVRGAVDKRMLAEVLAVLAVGEEGVAC